MKLIHIVGCRPNFIKLAPVYRAAIANSNYEHFIIHTGQHYDYMMSDVFFKDLEIPKPDINLGVKESSHGWQTGEMLKRIEIALLNQNYEQMAVVVYGDTNSTLAGALAAKKLKIPVIHVEAGLRCFCDIPEEINRVLVDHMSQFLFCPSKTGVRNLTTEGLFGYFVGDVTYDEFLWAQDKLEKPSDEEFILVTIHREENTDPEIFKQIEDAISKFVGIVYWPRHPKFNGGCPISYFEMLAKIRDARAVITDSAGVQKEAFWYGTPCFTLRSRTELIETLQMGYNKLIKIKDLTKLKYPATKLVSYAQFNPYGNGKAAENIINHLKGVL